MVVPTPLEGETEGEFFARAIPIVYAQEKNQIKLVDACNKAWLYRSQ